MKEKSDEGVSYNPKADVYVGKMLRASLKNFCRSNWKHKDVGRQYVYEQFESNNMNICSG